MIDTVLTSAHNPLIKQLRKLARSGKARREAGLHIAEGVHLVQSFLMSGKTPRIYLCADSAQRNQEVVDLIKQLDKTPAQKIVLSDSLFESTTNVHANSGICVVFEPKQNDVSGILPLTTTAVLLEGVQDPGNLGTILRTAAAVGIQNVLLSAACASPWSPKALRAGMGAQFNLALYEDIDLFEAVKTSSVPTVATTLGNDSLSLYTINLNRQIAWLFGSEGQGVSAALVSAASIRATIPQANNSVESLNVAAAAAVCLYEHYRQTILV